MGSCGSSTSHKKLRELVCVSRVVCSGAHLYESKFSGAGHSSKKTGASVCTFILPLFANVYFFLGTCPAQLCRVHLSARQGMGK